jgi:hypothetical protein
MEKPKGLMIAIAQGKPGPPDLETPKKKAAVPLFGAKHEAAETPEKEQSEESAVAKLAYVRGILQDALAACSEEEEEPEEEEETEEEMGA